MCFNMLPLYPFINTSANGLARPPQQWSLLSKTVWHNKGYFPPVSPLRFTFSFSHSTHFSLRCQTGKGLRIPADTLLSLSLFHSVFSHCFSSASLSLSVRVGLSLIRTGCKLFREACWIKAFDCQFYCLACCIIEKPAISVYRHDGVSQRYVPKETPSFTPTASLLLFHILFMCGWSSKVTPRRLHALHGVRRLFSICRQDVPILYHVLNSLRAETSSFDGRKEKRNLDT